MITFSVLSDSAVKLTFDGNSHYLQDGEITVPKNSLALVKDESELITFIKAATGDAYLSFHIEDTNFANYTELENWYKANMVSAYGGGSESSGISSGEVQTMIDNSISGKADTSDVTSAVTEFTAALSGEITRAMASEEALSGAVSAVTDALEDKVDVSELEEVELAVAQSINVLAQSVSGKQDTLQYITEDTEGGYFDIDITKAEGYANVDVSPNTFETIVGNLEDESDTGNTLGQMQVTMNGTALNIMGTIKTYDAENEEWVEESGNHELQSKEDGLYVDGEKIATVPMLNNKADASSVYTKTEVDTAFGMAMNSLHSLSGEVAAYSAATDAALSGKQDTLVAGSGITISGNVISADGSGGGATYSAGTNISIDTANTINCTLNLVNGGGTDSVKMKSTYSSNGRDSFAIGSAGVKASGLGSFAGGSYSEANKMFSMAFGRYAKANNYGEVALGFFNKSNGSSTAVTNSSGDTLFSVGNGTNAYGSEHNAFEIRQNGDIYCSDGTNDVKLQDTITATAENTTALGGLSLVKLTQVQYDALVTKDPNTLYIITNVVNNS